jgi:Zn-dependent peptidase ImmA (M78 family)/DNA-binding XRE family transcriptional regulator
LLDGNEAEMEKHILEQIDPRVLGTRLQDARRARGLTQQAVAEHLGVARTTVVAIEKGERRVLPEELIRLAALYGRPVSEFVAKQVVVEGFVPQFRAAWRHLFAEDAELEKSASELQRLAEDYVELEKLCDMPLVRAYPPPYDVSGASAEQIAEEIAAAERNRMGIGDGPLSNLRERLENDVGLRIFYFPMASKIAGLFAYNEVLGGCIGINSGHPRDRRHWSLAHECGHFLTGRYQSEITFLSEKKRSSARERIADSFAKHFLMPSSGLNRRFTEMHRASERGITLAHACTLADLYRVSVQALVLRLEELHRLPNGTWERLEAEGFKVRRAQQLLGIEANPPFQHLLPQRYVDLAILAYHQDKISEGQMARFLRTDRVAARAQVEDAGRRFNEEADDNFTSIELDLAAQLDGK